jgi:V/A-type H+-transporting ATPase subunit F
MFKAVAVGEKNLILGFKGVGLEIVPIDDNTKLMHELNILARDPEIGLVLVTESMAKDAPQAIEEFRGRSSAILTIIPSHEGSRHLSFLEMRKSVERSLGVDILGKDQTRS